MFTKIIENPSKKPLYLIIVGIIITGFGLFMGYKPEIMQNWKAKIHNLFGK